MVQYSTGLYPSLGLSAAKDALVSHCIKACLIAMDAVLARMVDLFDNEMTFQVRAG